MIPLLNYTTVRVIVINLSHSVNMLGERETMHIKVSGTISNMTEWQNLLNDH